jgi:S-adenosylmethionine:tRNA ribosyltransferase-isomerase
MSSMMPFPESIVLSDYSYELPDEKIARYPLAERDSSKLLVWKPGSIQESTYSRIADFLPVSALMVFNNSRVVEARIQFQKPDGGQIEIFCLEPHESYSDISLAMKQTEKVLWNCLIGGASKWKRGQVLYKELGETRLNAHFIAKRKDDFTVALSWIPKWLTFAELLQRMGSIPLPPYLKRN